MWGKFFEKTYQLDQVHRSVSTAFLSFNVNNIVRTDKVERSVGSTLEILLFYDRHSDYFIGFLMIILLFLPQHLYCCRLYYCSLTHYYLSSLILLFILIIVWLTLHLLQLSNLSNRMYSCWTCVRNTSLLMSVLGKLFQYTISLYQGDVML